MIATQSRRRRRSPSVETWEAALEVAAEPLPATAGELETDLAHAREIAALRDDLLRLERERASALAARLAESEKALRAERRRRRAEAAESGRRLAVVQAELERLGADRHAQALAHLAIARSRAYRFLDGYWRWRRRLGHDLGLRRLAARLMAGMRALRAAAGAGLAAAGDALWRLALARRHRAFLLHLDADPAAPPLKSAYAAAWERYRRLRVERYGCDFSALATPGEVGLVSIVLPVYNGGALLAEAIASVLAQTYADFELIVVDDGSTDDTPEVVAAFERRDPRVRGVRQGNAKLPRALSTGFRQARGELLTWLSADNRLRPDFLERMVDCLRRHPRWDAAYGNLDIIGDDGRPLRRAGWYSGYQVPPGSEHVHLPHDVAELNVWPNNYVAAAFLYRRRVAELLGDYGEAWFTAEDYDYWMRVNDVLTLRHVDFEETVYEYRFHDASLTAQADTLDIRGQTRRLLLFEDARRDLFLGPVLWSVEAGRGRAAASAAAALVARARDCGHAVAQPGFDAASLPRLGVPRVELQTAAAEAAASLSPRRRLPGALQALVVVTPGNLPTAVDPGWDLCLVLGPTTVDLPSLGGRRGWLRAGDLRTLFAALDVRAKSETLRGLEAEIEAVRRAAPPSLRASVVIPSDRGGPTLERAIASAARQRLAGEAFEVLVVGNGPEARRIAESVEATRRRLFPARQERLRYVESPFRGVSSARNAGLYEARGEVVAFLDDDGVARPDWLERLLDAFDVHPDAGVIGGSILLDVASRPSAALRPGWERFWSDFRPPEAGYTEVREWASYPWGCNWAARRRAMVEAGGFRLSFGRAGNDYWGGEELVAAALVERSGWRVALLPEAEVLHRVDRRRLTWRHLRRTVAAGHLAGWAARLALYRPWDGSRLGADLGEALRTLRRPPADATAARAPFPARWRFGLYHRLASWRVVRLLGAELRRRLEPAWIELEDARP